MSKVDFYNYYDIYLSAKNFAKLSTISFHYLNAIGNLAKDWYRQVFRAHLVSKTMSRKHPQVDFHIYLSLTLTICITYSTKVAMNVTLVAYQSGTVLWKQLGTVL